MTNEQAIDVLNMVEAHGLADEAKKLAIKALQNDRPQGEWITTTARTYCSNCDYYEYNSKAQELLRKFNYCPNCGADMQKGGAE